MHNSVQPVIRYLNFEESLAFLKRLSEADDLRLFTDTAKNTLAHYDDSGSKVFEFRPPLPLSPLPSEIEKLSAYAEEIPDLIPNYMIVLMQAGYAALGYFEEGEVYFHKAVSTYMVRKKRGKAQITYLNQKGKSRAGSRIRLANTHRFLEDISAKLHEWMPSIEDLNRVLYSSSPALWSMLFDTKKPPPFNQRDELLIKIPLDVGVPKFEELNRINQECLKGRLYFYRPFFHDKLEIDSEEF